MRNFLAFLFLSLIPVLTAQATLWVSSPEPPIKIGVLRAEHLDETAAAQAILLDKLRREFQPRLVNLTYYDWNDLEKAIKGHALDLILVNSSFFSTIEHEKETKALVGLVRDTAIDADHMLAGTLITKSSEKNIPLRSLKGKELYLADKADEINVVFSEYLMNLGIKEKSFFSQVKYVKGGVNELIDVVEKKTDAVALLPACSLEEHSDFRKNSLSKVTVIDEKFGDGLNCKRTTNLFPGWLLASVKQDDMDMVRKATAAALTTVMADSLKWGFPPENFNQIRNVLIDMKYGPYAKIEPMRLYEFLYVHRYWVLVFFAVILLVIAHSVILGIQVRIKTQDIRSLMEEKIKFSREIANAKERIQVMEKFQSVNQLSGLLAHDLKQPLGAIRNYSRGLVKRAKKHPIDQDVLYSALTVIVNESDKAAGIVEQVRNYAKNISVERKVLDLNQIARETVQTFRNSYDFSIPIKFSETAESVPVEVNALEIELATVNLLKNAAEALEGISNPEILVMTSKDQNHAILSISDNGKKYSDEEIQRFFKPLFTAKEKGMGLGLAIVNCIAEGHGGRIKTLARKFGGVTFQIIIPLSKN